MPPPPAPLLSTVNLSAPFLLSEALLPLMAADQQQQQEEAEGVSAAAAAATGGSIIHIASTRALQSEPNSEVWKGWVT